MALRQYAALSDTSEYDAILEHLQPVNSFSGKEMDVQGMPYSNVKYCFRLFGKIDSWEVVQSLFEIAFDVTEEEFWGVPLSEFFSAKKYLIRAFEAAANAEAKNLSGNPTDEHLWLMAGADRLKPLGDILPLVQLGKQFGQYPFDLGRKPYGEVISLLIASKVQGEVEQEFMKLKTK